MNKVVLDSLLSGCAYRIELKSIGRLNIVIQRVEMGLLNFEIYNIETIYLQFLLLRKFEIN
jgi:hypothetical protein